MISFTYGTSTFYFFFFQAEDGIRDVAVTGVQTCALPILTHHRQSGPRARAELLGREARLEDPLEMLPRDSHPVILDRQAQRFAHLPESDYDRRVPLPRRRDRIADEVGEHLIQGVGITLEKDAAHGDDPLERDAALERQRPLQRHA